ncbi:HAD family hydrolase [Verrucomicrobiaceae bacterium 227]
MKYTSLLFDWSGTLVDDLPPTLHATNEVLLKYGVPAMDREEFRLRFRLPYPEFYEEVLPGVPIADLEGIFRSSFNQSPVRVTVLPHAREMLAWCREHGIRCFVLSSMDVGLFTEQAHEFGLHDHFEAIYAGVIDKRHRIGGILEDHGLELSKTAFVGDMVHDIETARHGGVDAIAVTTGYDPVARLTGTAPSHLFNHLGDFREWLERSLLLP